MKVVIFVCSSSRLWLWSSPAVKKIWYCIDVEYRIWVTLGCKMLAQGKKQLVFRPNLASLETLTCLHENEAISFFFEEKFQKGHINTKNAFFAWFRAYFGQPHGHIGWATSMSLISINFTNARTNPWHFCEKILRIGRFGK